MLQGYRTYIVAAIIGAIGFLAELSAEKWMELFNDPAGGIGWIVGGVAMAAMRKVTTTPPGKAARGESAPE